MADSILKPPTIVLDIDSKLYGEEWTFRTIAGDDATVRVPRSMNTVDVAKKLLDTGLPAPPGKLTEEVNKARRQELGIPERRTGKPGWHDGTFVSWGCTAGPDEGLRLFLENTRDGVFGAPAGSLAGWKSGLAGPCQASTYLPFAIGVGFASVLLDFIGEKEGAVFNLHAESSAGKSLSGRAAQSIAARAGPTDVVTYDLTPRALEELCFDSCDHPCFIDEWGRQNGGAKAASRFAYMVASGVGKVRSKVVSGADLPDARWRVFAITTGEKALPRDRAGGEIVRHIDIPLPKLDDGGIFNRETERGCPADHAREVELAIAANYGVALKPFVGWLLKGGDRLRAKAQREIEEFLEWHVPDGDGWERRFARKIAIVDVAMYFAARAGVAPWPSERATTVTDLIYKIARNAVADTSTIANRVVKVVGEAQSDGMFPALKKGVSLPEGSQGFVRGPTLALEPSYFDSLCGSRATSTAVRSLLNERGVLEFGADGKSTQQLLVPGRPRRSRWVCLSLARLRDTKAT